MTDAVRARSRRVIAAAALLAAAIALSGCGGKAKASGTPRKIKHLPDSLVAATVLDLNVKAENDKVSSDEFNKERRSYVQAVGLYSFRRGDLLQATLQVSRFKKSAPVDQQRFRDTIIGQIAQAGQETQVFRMAGHRVYLNPGTQQSVAIWFGPRTLQVLTVRREYSQPRALLRALLGVKA